MFHRGRAAYIVRIQGCARRSFARGHSSWRLFLTRTTISNTYSECTTLTLHTCKGTVMGYRCHWLYRWGRPDNFTGLILYHCCWCDDESSLDCPALFVRSSFNWTFYGLGRLECSACCMLNCRYFWPYIGLFLSWLSLACGVCGKEIEHLALTYILLLATFYHLHHYRQINLKSHLISIYRSTPSMTLIDRDT